MRLCIEKRTRILSLYYKHGLGDKKKRFQKLTNFAAMEDIFISSRCIDNSIIPVFGPKLARSLKPGQRLCLESIERPIVLQVAF